MVLSLLWVTLLAPVLITVGLLYTAERLSRHSIPLSILAIIAWLPLYAWMLKLPNLPPKQALDWVWIYLMFAGAGVMCKVVTFHRVNKVAAFQSVTFFITAGVMIWPAISYNASLASHWSIWLESIVFGLMGVVVLLILIKPLAKADQSGTAISIHSHIYLWLITGALGVIVIMTGSLLIGSLSIALSSIFVASGLYARFFYQARLPITPEGLPVSYGLVLLMLLISRVYVDVDIMTFSLLAISVVLASYLTLKQYHNPAQYRLLHIVFVTCLAIAIAYTVYSEVLSTQNNGYY